MTIGDDELHAWVDGQLSPERARAVETAIAGDADAQRRAEDYRRQNELLRRAFDPVLAEPVPARLRVPVGRRTGVWPYAAAILTFALGGILGWVVRGQEPAMPALAASLPERAAVAHAVYTPDVLHPVEVGADQEEHLVQWLSKRLGLPVRAPVLRAQGYDLVGGRLLPGDDRPAAQFMYQDAHGQRLTLYVSRTADGHDTAFRYARENGLGVFYWVDGPVGYALAGDMDRAQLLALSERIYRELNR